MWSPGIGRSDRSPSSRRRPTSTAADRRFQAQIRFRPGGGICSDSDARCVLVRRWGDRSLPALRALGGTTAAESSIRLLGTDGGPVKTSILNGLGDVLRLDGGRACPIGDRTRLTEG